MTKQHLQGEMVNVDKLNCPDFWATISPAPNVNTPGSKYPPPPKKKKKKKKIYIYIYDVHK